MRGFWRADILIWHVPGQAYFGRKFRLSYEGLNECNTLPSTVTYPKTDLHQHIVRPL